MTSEVKNNFNSYKPLSYEALNHLQQQGYRYLQVQGYTLDYHPEYVEPHYLMLVPIKELSSKPGKMDIYTDINSDLIKEWINASDDSDRLEILLANKS